MSRYREEMKEKLHEQKCPSCNGKKIGIGAWGMFKGKRGWFYFCKECDDTFDGKEEKWFITDKE